LTSIGREEKIWRDLGDIGDAIPSAEPFILQNSLYLVIAHIDMPVAYL
jgi:hypothetical protein